MKKRLKLDYFINDKNQRSGWFNLIHTNRWEDRTGDPSKSSPWADDNLLVSESLVKIHLLLDCLPEALLLVTGKEFLAECFNSKFLSTDDSFFDKINPAWRTILSRGPVQRFVELNRYCPPPGVSAGVSSPESVTPLPPPRPLVSSGPPRTYGHFFMECLRIYCRTWLCSCYRVSDEDSSPSLLSPWSFSSYYLYWRRVF